MSNLALLDFFNALVVDKTSTPYTGLVPFGVVTDFVPDSAQRAAIEAYFKPLPITTLFSKEERLNSDISALIYKQLLHYVEVYGLGAPGLFDLEVTTGKIVKISYVKGISFAELGDKVRELLYRNAPLAKLDDLMSIINDFGIAYDFDKILNNEIRIRLYDPKKHRFATGDDAVRYMVFKATGQTMVIKSKRAQAAIKTGAPIDPMFFYKNDIVLSQVFNRFKPLILAAKNANTRVAINNISRMSKTNHVPVFEGLNKRFLSEAIKAYKNGSFDSFAKSVSRLSVRDKFKLLNLIEYKALGLSVDSFVIRNGTVHIEKDRKVLDTSGLIAVQNLILQSLYDVDFKVLSGKKILLDPRVDYGLPISRKQALGNLPYGTKIESVDEISSGIYWHNDGGARDLDLSTVDHNGQRTGWGGYRGYEATDIIFSGDLTSAYDGAMEFMTSKNSNYGLFVNIFNGDMNAEFELVVGTTNSSQWIDDLIVREKSKLLGRGSVIGFVNGTTFTVFQGKLNDRIANFDEGSPVLNRGKIQFWTVKRLFNMLDVEYDTEAKPDVEYDVDLTYSNFSLDKLESLLYTE